MPQANDSFVFPIARLENSRIRLVEFDLDLHGDAFVAGVKDYPELYKYMPIGPVSDTKTLNEFLDARIRSSNTSICFAIMVKPNFEGEEEVLAGMIGYLAPSAENCAIEVGYITILPRFQGTFVTKNATGLLVMHALDPPPYGLGLRRCEWQCHSENEASKRFATKMLFTFEGIQRFQRVIPHHKLGNGYDTSNMQDLMDRKLGPSRDSAIYAHYCDEWEAKRPWLVKMMDA